MMHNYRVIYYLECYSLPSTVRIYNFSLLPLQDDVNCGTAYVLCIYMFCSKSTVYVLIVHVFEKYYMVFVLN